MMEEVGDDTNGESSFEFISGKIDENLKDNNGSANEPFYISPVAPLDSSNFPISIPNISSAYPVASQTSVSNITFYDPKDSQSVMLPPPIPMPSSTNPPLTSSASQNQYPPVQVYSTPPPPSPPVVSQNYQIPPNNAQQPYFSPTGEHALTLGLEPSFNLSEHRQHEGEVGVWGWLKGKDFLHKVAEKAKNSVDSVITTLDPGMKEIINTGGDINVIVASGNEDKISAVREAFQLVFGKATVQGTAVQSNSIAPQPVGFSAGLKATEERINNLKQMGFAQDKQILLAIENFLTELTPENWFDMGCLLLQDQSSGITLQVYTEAIPVPVQYVSQAKDQTPPDYPLGWSGYAVTIGQIMGPALGVHHSMWHQALTGVSRREILLIAAKTIAGLYRSKLGR